ncbi:MAG: hypothetical protein Q7K26_04505 [bacterium]|nr:hypothetical protein [bacterium]
MISPVQAKRLKSRLRSRTKKSIVNAWKLRFTVSSVDRMQRSVINTWQRFWAYVHWPFDALPWVMLSRVRSDDEY